MSVPKSLQLAPGLTLPLDAVSRTFGVLAVRGAGKSNTAAVMAEEMFAAGLPFVVIDPVGSWFGLRSAGDGSQAGLPIPIFGGKHGDVPLERGAGELIADLVVEKRLTCVLDLSRFESEADKKVFLIAFARRLYLKNENPLHLFLEEADDYIPQSPMGDEKQLLRAWENIVRRGRSRGLGMTIITQRSAAVSKMVLTQVETLFAMRTTGPQDIAAIEAWVKYHQVGRHALTTLASLNDGEAWVWSPHYLKMMARHQMRRRHTFDSGATPANVRAKDTRPPATLADIDIAGLQERMTATIEKAKAEDPKELRKQLADKDRRIRELERATVVPATLEATEPVALLTETDRALLQQMHTHLASIAEFARIEADVIVERVRVAVASAIDTATVDMLKLLDATDRETSMRLDQVGFNKVLDKLLAHQPAARAFGQQFEAARQPRATMAPRPTVRHGQASTVTAPQQRILNAINWAERYRLPVQRREKVAFLAAASPKSSAYINNLGALRSAGLIDYPQQGYVALTPAGRALALVDSSDPSTAAELQETICNKLPAPQARIIRALCNVAPRSLTRQALAQQADASVTSSAFINNLGALRSLGLLDYPQQGVVVASPVLFMEAQ